MTPQEKAGKAAREFAEAVQEILADKTGNHGKVVTGDYVMIVRSSAREEGTMNSWDWWWRPLE